MTVAIKESLTKLNSSLVELEKTANQAQAKSQDYQTKAQEYKEEATAQKQAAKSSPDLFSVPKTTASAEDDVDTKALASRLDNAIERVEELLKEGA